jgi:hypothetical protein
LYFIERKEPIRNTHARVLNLIEALKLDKPNGTLRQQPYCVHLSGPPGTSKTTLAIRIAQAIMRAKYGKALPSHIVTLNESDDFQSEYRSDHKVVIFDDLGADILSAPEAKNPWRKILDFVNNVRKTAINPNVDMKGTVQIQPDLVLITSNAFPGDIDTMKCPSAIYRRLKKCYFVGPRDHSSRILRILSRTHRDSTMRMHDSYTAANYVSPDTLVFEAGGSCKAMPTNMDQLRKYTITEEVMIKEILEDFLVHDAEQRAFVKSVNDGFDEPDKPQTLYALTHYLSYPNKSFSRFLFWDMLWKFRVWKNKYCKVENSDESLDLSAESSRKPIDCSSIGCHSLDDVIDTIQSMVVGDDEDAEMRQDQEDRRILPSFAFDEDDTLDTLSMTPDNQFLEPIDRFPETEILPVQIRNYAGQLISHSDITKNEYEEMIQSSKMLYQAFSARYLSRYQTLFQLFTTLPSYNARGLSKVFEMRDLQKILLVLGLAEALPNQIPIIYRAHQPFDSCKVIVINSFLIIFESDKLSFCKMHFGRSKLNDEVTRILDLFVRSGLTNEDLIWSHFVHNETHVAFIADDSIPVEHVIVLKKFYFLYKHLFGVDVPQTYKSCVPLQRSKSLSKIFQQIYPKKILIPFEKKKIESNFKTTE